MTKREKLLERAFLSFKEFCQSQDNVEAFEDSDWKDLSLGFFMALGLTIDESRDLASRARYDEHYWS